MAKAPKGSKQSMLNKAMPIFLQTKLGDVIGDILNTMNTGMLTKAGLAIVSGGASPTVAAANAFLAMVNGTVVEVPAATAMSAIAGTLATANSGAWAFFINSAGTISSSAMATGATNSAAITALVAQIAANQPAAVGPQQVVEQALIGCIIVANATGGNFTAGTTNLDAASVTTTYFDFGNHVQLVPIVNLESRAA
jgi:hypothetical protein